MPLNTRSPAVLPGTETPKTYADYLQHYMNQMGLKPKPMYDVAAPEVAPQSPMQVNPGQILGQIGKGAAMQQGASAAIANIGGQTAAADALIGTTMPQIGPTLANAAALPTTSPVAGAGFGNLGLTSAGAGPLALGAIGAGIFANNIYEGGGKDIIRGKGKRDDYTNLLLDINPVTAPINMGLRALGMRSVGRQMKTGKSDDQLQRDSIRSLLQGSGIADDKYLVNGFDIGKDGGARLQNVGTNISGKTDRGYYDVDFSNPLASKSIEGLRGIASATLGEKASEKQTNDLIGMLSNAVLSNATDETALNKNLSSLYSKAGLQFSGATAPAAVRAAIPRSSTISPGIRKDGTRIDYSKKGK